MATTSSDMKIKIWSILAKKCLEEIDVSGISEMTSITFSPDGNFIAMGGNSCELLIWDC